MRYKELVEARPWKKYEGHSRRCLLLLATLTVEVTGHCGIVVTGRTETFHGYYVRISGFDGREWLAEDRQSLRAALIKVADQIEESHGRLLAVGLLDEWRETGMSGNTGWGDHPAFDRAVHMLDPIMNAADDR
jgi:hypothetical protein